MKTFIKLSLILVGMALYASAIFACYSFYKIEFITSQTVIIEKKPRISSISKTSMSYDLFQLANMERKLKLKWNDCLADKAVERAKSISKTGLFSHQDATGKFPYESMIDMCVNYLIAGENLTENFYTANDIHYALMNSPTHKANIIGNYNQMGVGCFNQYCVEFFAK